MELETAIHDRRTLKEGYDATPVSREVLEELFDLARWAPNHRLNQPWRFRVLGPESLDRLRAAAGAGAGKLGRAPTLVVATAVLSDNELHAEEDRQAAACAAYIVLLAAHARGYASYWRTPGVLRTSAGREALGLAPDEHVIGLIHLGTSDLRPDPPTREPAGAFVTYLS